MKMVKNVKVVNSEKLRKQKELLKIFAKEYGNKNRINTNWFVTVKLTERGRKQLIDFNTPWNPSYDINKWVKEDGTYRVQLHELMLEFGGVLYSAFEPPFENCVITIG